jgi:hypothetical protein
MDSPTTQGGVLAGYSLLLHGGTKWAAQFGLLLRHAGATVADTADVRSHGGLAGASKRLVVVEVRTKRAARWRWRHVSETSQKFARGSF